MKRRVSTAEGFDPDGRHSRVLIANEFVEVVLEAVFGFSETFFREIPRFRMDTDSLLCVSIQSGCGDHQKIFADHLDPVLSALIVLKCPSTKQHGVKYRTGQSTTGPFDEQQVGTNLRMSEGRVKR
jgi:hypothetical protein